MRVRSVWMVEVRVVWMVKVRVVAVWRVTMWVVAMPSLTTGGRDDGEVSDSLHM